MDSYIYKMYFIFLMLLGPVIIIYGLLVSLDKLRIDRESITRIVCISIFPWLNLISIGMEDVRDRGEYTTLCIVTGIIICMMVLLNKLFKRSYIVFNLVEEEAFSYVKNALDNINIEYEIDGGGITINNLCYIQITKVYPYMTLKGKEVKDKKLFESVMDNIKKEVHNYKLPKRTFYKGGYLYIGLGLALIAVLPLLFF